MALLQAVIFLRLGYVLVFFSPIYRDMEPALFWAVTLFGFLVAAVTLAGAIWVDQWPEIRLG